MAFYSWQNVKKFYQYHTRNNNEFLTNINKIPLTNYDDEHRGYKEQIQLLTQI